MGVPPVIALIPSGWAIKFDGSRECAQAIAVQLWPHISEEARAKILPVIRTRDTVVIQHVEDKQIFHGVNDNLRAAALSLGYSEELLNVVQDNEGRPVFEIFRFNKF